MATYYVSATTGLDTRTPSQAQSLSTPWLTIQKAADNLNPSGGDVVRVDDGTYSAGGRNAAVVSVEIGGAAGNYNKFQSINKWGAKLDGQNNALDYGFRPFGSSASFVEFDDFDMFGMAGSGVFLNYAGTSDFRVVGCDFHAIGRQCTDDDHGRVGIFSSCPSLYVDRCRFHNIGRFANGEFGCTTIIPSNHDHGVYLSGSGNQTVTVTNSLFYDLLHGWAMQFQAGNPDSILIANNVFDFFNPDREGQVLFISVTTCSNIRIHDNASINAHTGCFYFYDGAYSNTTLKNNIVRDGSSQIIGPGKSGTISETGLITTDPLFVNPPTDYSTQAGPARDGGVVVAEVTADFIGTARPQGVAPDIGAYEFASAAIYPSVSGSATTNGTAAVATKTINLPAGIIAGETLGVLIRTAVVGGHTFPAGWTELYDSANDGSGDQTAFAWRKADGTEGASIQVTSANAKFAAIAIRVTSAADPTILPPQVALETVGTSTAPDPGGFSPTGGSLRYLWLWVGGWEGEQTSPPVGAPTNYTSLAGADSGTAGAVTTNCRVALATRQLQAASEDPPSWTISVADDWTATTLAFYPSDAPIPPPPPPPNSIYPPCGQMAFSRLGR